MDNSSALDLKAFKCCSEYLWGECHRRQCINYSKKR